MTFKIYTRTGDTGTTGIFGGKRLSKADLRIDAIGDVDELNAVIGVAASHKDKEIAGLLSGIQKTLFVLGSELAQATGKKSSQIKPEDVTALEKTIDSCDAKLPKLKNFILPCGTQLGAVLFLARATCRRAERSVVRLAGTEPVNSNTTAFLNRLSDLLFVLARYANHKAGVQEFIWRP